MPQFLSPKEFAHALGVSESSVKRWADEGLIAVTRTAGGHRRIARREAVRYIRQAHLPVVNPQLLDLGDVPAAAEGREGDAALANAIVDGRSEDARGLAIAMYLAGRPVAELCDGPLAAAMHTVGELWRHGPDGIYREHCAVDTVTLVLSEIRSLLPELPAAPPVALGGGVEGDPYTLPSLMVATVLGAAGWQALNLGANAPVAALEAGVEHHRPRLIWVCCSVDAAATAHSRALRKAIPELLGSSVQMLIGGRGWTPATLPEHPRVKAVRSMAEVAAFAQGLRAALPEKHR